MNNKKKLIYSIVLYFISACSIKYQNEEIKLNKDLEFLIEQQYKECKKIEGLKEREYIDSIYIVGNLLLKNIGTEDYFQKYYDYHAQYGGDKFQLGNWENCNDVKTTIQIIQLYALNDEIQSFYQSHFQVDLVGLYPNNRLIKVNKKETIELVPHYISAEIKEPPIVTIGMDTLKFNGISYEYEILEKDTGTKFFDAEIFVERWGKIRGYKCNFRIEIMSENKRK